MMNIFSKILKSTIVPYSKYIFFENFTVDFQVSYFRKKKLSVQIVVCFPVSTYKSQCFKIFYDFILGHGLDSPGFKSNGIIRNDNLFFKRVTDIIIPVYLFSIGMKERAKI